MVRSNDFSAPLFLNNGTKYFVRKLNLKVDKLKSHSDCCHVELEGFAVTTVREFAALTLSADGENQWSLNSCAKECNLLCQEIHRGDAIWCIGVLKQINA